MLACTANATGDRTPPEAFLNGDHHHHHRPVFFMTHDELIPTHNELIPNDPPGSLPLRPACSRAQNNKTSERQHLVFSGYVFVNCACGAPRKPNWKRIVLCWIESWNPRLALHKPVTVCPSTANTPLRAPSRSNVDSRACSPATKNPHHPCTIRLLAAFQLRGAASTTAALRRTPPYWH